MNQPDTNPLDKYEIRTWAGKYSDRWVVIRNRDQKVMTEGNVIHCIRWVNVWGNVRA